MNVSWSLRLGAWNIIDWNINWGFLVDYRLNIFLNNISWSLKSVKIKTGWAKIWTNRASNNAALFCIKDTIWTTVLANSAVKDMIIYGIVKARDSHNLPSIDSIKKYYTHEMSMKQSFPTLSFLLVEWIRFRNLSIELVLHGRNSSY